ncbi:MAG: hypothetical protein ABI600_16820 [Luteolibacter sp.]
MIFFGDVDIALKLASCGFLPILCEILGVPQDMAEFRRLASLRNRAKKLGESARADLTKFCDDCRPVDGASDVGRHQELLNLGMDSGEALLFAEAEAVGGVVITGDKRAISDYQKCSTPEQRAKVKVVCWEMILLRINEMKGFEYLKTQCCSALECDKLLLLAFRKELATEESHVLECLKSYLGGVEKHSGDILYKFT